MAGRPGDLAVTGKIAADRTTVQQFTVPWLADINLDGGWRSTVQRHAGLLASLDLTLMRLPGASLSQRRHAARATRRSRNVTAYVLCPVFKQALTDAVTVELLPHRAEDGAERQVRMILVNVLDDLGQDRGRGVGRPAPRRVPGIARWAASPAARAMPAAIRAGDALGNPPPLTSARPGVVRDLFIISSSGIHHLDDISRAPQKDRFTPPGTSGAFCFPSELKD